MRQGHRGPAGGVDQEAAVIVTPLGLLPPVDRSGGLAAHHLPLPVPGLGTVLGGPLVGALTGLLRALAQDFLRQLAAPVATYVLRTPDLLAEPTLRAYWLTALGALTCCAGLAVALAGVAVSATSTSVSSALARSAREAVSVRLPGGMLVAAVSLPLVSLEVELANGLVTAFVGTGFAAGHDALWTTLTRAAAGDPGAGLGLLVVAIVGVVLLVGLVLVGLARWATLWLLVVLAPLAMGFALLPGGAGIGRLWWRLQLATVFLPVANAVLLGTYVAMFSSQRTGLVGALSGVAVLALMGKLPTWLAGAAVGVEGHDLAQRLRRGHQTARRVVAVAAATSSTGGMTGALGRPGRMTPTTGKGPA